MAPTGCTRRLRHCDAATAPLPPATTRACHQDVSYPVWTGIWAGAGHPGGGLRRLQRDDTHQDQDVHNGVLSEPAQIRGDLIGSMDDQRERSSGWRRTRNKEEVHQVGDRVHALPQDEHGKL